MITLDEQIEILEAKKAGKDVEVRHQSCGPWHLKYGKQFNFVDYEYRIKPGPMEFWLNVPTCGEVGFKTKEEAEAKAKDCLMNVTAVKFREAIE